MWLGSNPLNDAQISLYMGFDGNKEDTKQSVNISGNLDWKISDYFNISFNLNWSQSYNALQYVTEQDFQGDPHYILGEISRETLSTYAAFNLNLTPNMSLEYRARPYFTSAKYDKFSLVVDGENENLNDRFDTFTSTNLKYDDGKYFCDPDRNNSWDYSFNKPDFVYSSVQSNLVFRWEYYPGSTVYLVWSFNSSVGSSENMLILADNIHALQDRIPDNIILIKASYRLGR
jgi:hypothetical protein